MTIYDSKYSQLRRKSVFFVKIAKNRDYNIDPQQTKVLFGIWTLSLFIAFLTCH
jgi:hypothetical protein